MAGIFRCVEIPGLELRISGCRDDLSIRRCKGSRFIDDLLMAQEPSCSRSGINIPYLNPVSTDNQRAFFQAKFDTADWTVGSKFTD